MNTILLPLLFLLSQQQLPPVLLTDQSQHRILMVSIPNGTVYWEWKPEAEIQPDHRKWFNNPSDVKMVLNGRFIITCASSGGVALIRLQDGKTVWYDYAGGNTHSADILPDLNIVTASSTGNYLMLFHADTTGGYVANRYKKKLTLPDAHSAVWYLARFWAAGRNKLYIYRYNFSRETPDLHMIDSVKIPGKDAHDLFPAPGPSLLLTTTDTVLQMHTSTKKFSAVKSFNTHHVKSISAIPGNTPVLLSIPKEEWWTDELFDENGKSMLKMPGLKIYKARWAMPFNSSARSLRKDGTEGSILQPSVPAPKL